MRVDDLRQELESLAGSAPVPPVNLGAAVRRGRARRARTGLLAAAAATTAGVVIVVGVARIERDTHQQVVRAGPGTTVDSTNRPRSTLGDRALPANGLIVLDSPRNGEAQQPGSWSIALLDDAGQLLTQLPRKTIEDDVINYRWNERVVATDTDTTIEHIPLDHDDAAPSGCTVTVRSPTPVALCGARFGDQILGTRIMIRVGDGWATLIGLPPRPGGQKAGGHWSWAAPSPDGRWVLAQWSGECERQTGMLISAPDGAIRAVTGEAGTAWTTAPASAILGWTADGRALFQLESSCDDVAPSPGIYFVEPGAGPKHLLRALSSTAVVLRWTNVSDLRTPSVTNPRAPTTTAPDAARGLVLTRGWLSIPSSWILRGDFSSGGSSVETQWYNPNEPHGGMVVTVSGCRGCGRDPATGRPLPPLPQRTATAINAYRFRYDDTKKQPGEHQVFLYSEDPVTDGFGYVKVTVSTDDAALADAMLSFTKPPLDDNTTVHITMGPMPPL